LRPPPNIGAMAHVSWVAGEQGVLRPGDLLPEQKEKTAAKITLELPAGWRVGTTEKRAGEAVFEVDDLDRSVFAIGSGWREKRLPVADGGALDLLVAGAWKFSDDEAAQLTGAIFSEYNKLFGGRSFNSAAVYLGRFPDTAKAGRWEAETRGAAVTIYSADMPFSTQSVQRLHEQLRHEIFHLWIPNDLNLAGNYDWFYEGFALYQSLRLAVGTNRIRFDDYLDTLGRAYDIDALQSRRTSLIEASQSRWNGADTQVYARGMLVAFLTDLALLDKSKGKDSLTDLLREIYQKHRRPNAPREDANAAILKILEARAELRPIVEKYVKGAENIDWRTDLAAAGIETATENFSTKLKVAAKPGGRQKDLLDKLGYNNWRKRSEVSK
jgi:predicted metalloprotease with PDZ domain